MKKTVIVSLLSAELLWSLPVMAGFLEAGVSETISRGKFRITLTDELIRVYGIEQLESPVLFDAHTKIGRSTPHWDESSVDRLTGAFICQDGYIDACIDFFSVRVVDYDFPRVPLTEGNPFDEGPAGTEEIHTQILALQLADTSECGTQSATAVRAGYAAADAPPSFGEVESLNPPGSVGGFPAEGFFNVFVEVDVDWNNDGIVDKTLFNKQENPLVIQNGQLENFPPITFLLQSDGAVPVYDKTKPLGNSIGWLELIGQDRDFKCEGDRTLRENQSPMAPLRAFTATNLGNKVLLAWEVTAADSREGFYLWRARKDEEGNFIDILRLTEQWIPFNGEQYYFYEDKSDFTVDTYYYGVEEVIAGGISTIHMDSIVSVQREGR